MSRKIDDNEWEDAAHRVNDPPIVPRERMWQAIDAARREQRQVAEIPTLPQARSKTHQGWRMAAAMAAVLVLGIAVGRMTVNPNVPDATIDTDVPAVAAGVQPQSTINRETEKEVYRLAATDLFGRADFLLTDFNVRSCAQDDPGETPTWARGMLLQTRLLLDTPVAEDVEMNRLLEELELVLAQIVSLSRQNCARDMAWIKQGLQERSTLDRLRIMSTDVNQGPL